MHQLMPHVVGKLRLPAAIEHIFSEATTKFADDFAKQAEHIVRAHRPAGLPERFQPTMNFSDWDRIQRERQKQRQEAEAQVRREQQQAEHRRLAQEKTEQQQLEQRKKDEVRIGEDTCDQLERDLRNTPLHQIAESIKQQWQAQSPNVPVTLTPFRKPKVEIAIWGDEIRNKSQVGIKLSYSHQEIVAYEGSGHYEGEGYVTDYEGYTGEIERQQYLTIGICFAHTINPNNTIIIPEARKPEYDYKGAKAYFMETSMLVNAPPGNYEPKVTMIAVPVEYPNSLQKLYELLAERENDLAPSMVIPEANLRVQVYRETHPEPKKGFWRSLF